MSFEPARFRSASVADRPGDWSQLYDRIISEVEVSGDLVLLHEKTDEAATYLRTNQAILDEAQKLARETTTEANPEIINNLLAVLVWEGKPHSEEDITAAFREEARARAIPTTEIVIQ